jgi:hypothetical protein
MLILSRCDVRCAAGWIIRCAAGSTHSCATGSTTIGLFVNAMLMELSLCCRVNFHCRVLNAKVAAGIKHATLARPYRSTNTMLTIGNNRSIGPSIGWAVDRVGSRSGGQSIGWAVDRVGSRSGGQSIGWAVDRVAIDGVAMNRSGGYGW